MKGLVAFVVISVIALILGLCNHLGAFKSVDLKLTDAGPYRVVYKPHFGAYHKIVPDIEEVERWAVKNGEACVTSFGEYLDDPATTDEDRLHSNGGCIVMKDWSGQKLPENFVYREIPRRLYLIADFEGAPSIGPQKVYPKASRYISDNHLKSDGPAIEMYERVNGGTIHTHYHFPVSR